ncbi:MAG: flagellar basal body-associated FliL family protein [Succinivibrionaceae bacterium]|nr:flagellar basal body-associated FliL family protein [Succinivibrionaceae bacterium]
MLRELRWMLAALLAALLLSSAAMAAGHGEEAPAEGGEESAEGGGEEGAPGDDMGDLPSVGPGGIAPEIGYYNMTPDFITNLAGTSEAGKFNYIRIKVAIMVLDDKDLPALGRYDALIRDEILNVISSKNIATASSASGRESLRAECRDHVALLLEDRLGHTVVQDLLFLSYMYM